MLKLPGVPGDKKTQEILTRFVSDRLADLMAEEILEAVEFDFLGEYTEADLSEADEDSYDLEKRLNLDALIGNEAFAGEVALLYVPEGTDPFIASWYFVELYRLLRAGKEYTLEPAFAYLIQAVISMEVWTVDAINEDTKDGLFDLDSMDAFDLLSDDEEEDDEAPFLDEEDEEVTTILSIPEPERSYVLSSLKRAMNGQVFTAQEILRRFEDLRDYQEICLGEDWESYLGSLDEASLFCRDALRGLEDEGRGVRLVASEQKGRGGEREAKKVPVPFMPWDGEE